jgi:hypothetical protein
LVEGVQILLRLLSARLDVRRDVPERRDAEARRPRLEGLNSQIRLINHRGYGHHSAAIIAMIYLCCGGITVELPFT